MYQSENTVAIMDIPFINCTLHQFMREYVQPFVEQEKKCFLVTANPEIVMTAKRDPSYQAIIQSANFVVPDGIGIIAAAKYKQQPLQERIAGIDLMKEMLILADERKASCFFLGAAQEVNDQAVANIHAAYPNIQIAGGHHGYFAQNDRHVAEQVIQAQPDFIFVALGSPKQEQWIAAHLASFQKGVFIGVGGSLDVFAGNVKRAPAIWIKCHLEWLYRLLKQPSRFRRMLPLAAFIWHVIRGRA